MVEFYRALAGVWVVGFALAGTACGAHPKPDAPGPSQIPVTLTPAAPEAGTCAPDRLVRCVPGLADFDNPIFNSVGIEARTSLFAALPASGKSPEEGFCKELPRFGARDDPELDVTYLPADSARMGPGVHPFPTLNTGDHVDVRLVAARADTDIEAVMTDWARQCPAWGFAHTLDNHGTQGWLLGESEDILARYRAGDIAGQWRNVIQVAAAVLPNGATVQTWYRTDDPSAGSRNRVLSQIVDAVGRPRPRSALPPQLDNWNSAQLSGLLPPLALKVYIHAKDSEPGEFVPMCQSGGGDPIAPYRNVAGWGDTDPEKWNVSPHPPAPAITINVPRPGVDYLAALHRQIAACTPHAHEIPDQCKYLPNHQFLQSDPAIAEGEDTLRITHRWIRVEDVQRYERCVERIETLRVTQVRGLLVISRSIDGGPKRGIGESPVLPSKTLDELQATTVRQIKAA